MDEVILSRITKEAYEHGYVDGKVDGYNLAGKAISKQRKKGKWVDDGGLYKCSNCNHLFSELWWVSCCPIDRMNKIMPFCPNCGAEMTGGDSSCTL